MMNLSGVWLEVCLGDNEAVSCRQLLEKELPQYIKNSFINYARKRLRLESPVSWNYRVDFDPDDKEVIQAREKLISALQASVRFTRSDVEACILSALRFRKELLLRPQRAIETYFFRKNDQSDKNPILKSLENYGQGIPFIECFMQQLRDYKSAIIKFAQVELLFLKARQELYTDQEQTTLISEYELLVDYYNVNGSVENRQLADDVVQELLHERGYRELFDTVRADLLKGEELWTRDIFLKMLDIIKRNPAPQEEFSVTFPRVVFSEDESFYIIQTQKIETQPPGPYPSIFDYIHRKDKKRFIRKLFKKDDEAFIKFINRIDKLSKWRDAKQIIDWELEMRRLDPYSKEAVKLGDVVFAKYFTKGKYS